MSTVLRTIVAGVAGVQPGETIYAPVIALARAAGAKLHFVHVYELPDPLLQAYARDGLLGSEFGARYRDQIRAKMEAEVRAISDDPTIECHAVAGSVSDVLCGTAESLGADLIIVGATRAGKLLRTILGSSAERVVRSARIPVLVLRQPHIQPLQRVLLTTDLSDFSAGVHERGLDLVEALSGDTPPELRSLLVVWYEMTFPPPLRRDSLEGIARGELQNFLDARTPRASTVEGKVRIGDPAKEITTEVIEWPADLLVLGTEGRTGRARFMLGSVAEATVRSTASNVLVLPPVGAGAAPGATSKARAAALV